MSAPLRLLHDEGGLVAVDKPPGLASTGRDLDDPQCVQFQLAARFRRKVWAVHQLDRDTSGVNLFVRRKSLVAVWQERLKPPVGQKVYLALCHGAPEWEERTVDAKLGYDRGAGRVVIGRGKPAVTDLRVLARGEDASWIEARPRTGRTHQIRVHLAHVGHPLVGERLHRSPPCELAPRHALHAARLRFAPPVTPALLESPLPDDLRAVAAALGLPAAPG